MLTTPGTTEEYAQHFNITYTVQQETLINCLTSHLCWLCKGIQYICGILIGQNLDSSF